MHGNPFLIASGSPNDPAFPLQRSVRLRSSATAYFTRTPASATNQRTWTWSNWVKRGALGTEQQIFEGGVFSGSTEQLRIFFTSTDNIEFSEFSSAAYQFRYVTTQVFRDTSSWYHIVAVLDTTDATSTNRVKLYINGVQVTSFSTSTTPTLNFQGKVNSIIAHDIGRRNGTGTPYLDGYLTEVNFVDGQALTPSSFGGYNAGTNVWEVRKYTGTYGTNGFYLPFTNNGAVENLGYDLANSSPELITNGMFVANVTGWTVTPTTGGSPTITWQSTHAARIANVSAFGVAYYQAIPTVIGQTYYAQTYISNINLGSTTRTVSLRKADDSSLGTNFAVLASIQQSAGSGVIRGTFVATATTTYIAVLADLAAASGSADFTAVSVTTDAYKNSWNPFGVSLTSGATYDSMLDVPTNTGSNNSNFATINSTFALNWLSQNGVVTSSGANLNYSIPVPGAMTGGTIGVNSGKWYWEYVGSSNYAFYGILSTRVIPTGGGTYYYYQANGGVYNYPYNSTTQTLLTTVATSNSTDIIGIALDMDNLTMAIYKNNTLLYTVTGIVADTYVPLIGGAATSTGGSINFGQRPFAQTPPSGFKSLNTYNLPEPTIPRGDKYFNQYLYTGNGGGLQVGEIQKPASLFNLDRSIRIRAAQNAYFSRTPSTNGNGQKFTISTWIKRGKIGTGWTDTIFTARTGTNFPELDIMFAGDLIKLQAYTTGAALLMNVDTVNLYRDTSMWYHVVAAFDTTQTIPADRVKVYVNGIAQTIAAGATYPSQNLVLNANQTVTQYIGSSPANTAWGDLYFADYYMIDGYQLTPTSFGAYDGNNYWTPKAYTGTYGTNGFHLEFKDYSGTTATTIGKDTSGNSNNFTPTGINLTAPANTNYSWDSMVDVPTLTSTDVASFATLNPLTGSNISSGNLQVTTSGAGDNHMSTIPLPNKGKWYAEMCPLTNNVSAINGWFGVSTVTGGSFTGLLSRSNTSAGRGFYSNGVEIVTGSFGALNDVIGVAVDMDALTVTIYINGVVQSNVMPIPSGTEMYFYFGTYTSGSGWVNFGQRPFKYSNYGVDRPAATFKTLNSFNIAEVLGDVETPDLVWIKSRSASTDHMLFNSVSGVGKYLRTSNTAVETTDVNSLIQFNKNGFLIGNNASINTSAATYVANAWKAGATQQTISVGQYATSPANIPSVASILSANQISGISIVTWTGTGTNNPTIAHGLGAIPAFIIAKDRDTNATDNNLWVYHKNLSANNYMFMNSTAAQTSGALNGWIGTSPTNTTFTIAAGSTSSNNLNESGDRFIAYCFSEIEGFSKFGTYLSNASPTDGPFVYTGFRPKWVIFKRLTGGTGGWFMYDAARNTYNTLDKYLFAEGIANEQTLAVVDYTSNGFKIRSSNTNINTTANTPYVYIAFAENPFKYALAR